jgi:hypothetical protein
MVQPLTLSTSSLHAMNALLLVHFIQRFSAYSSHCPATSESQCSLEEYDIDVSLAMALAHTQTQNRTM